jgi:hypothetical protein
MRAVRIAAGTLAGVVRQETMSEARSSLHEILDMREVQLGLQEAILQRLACSCDEEHARVQGLWLRARHPECKFDRKHRMMIYALALAPDQTGWVFKLQERLHRLLYH